MASVTVLTSGCSAAPNPHRINHYPPKGKDGRNLLEATGEVGASCSQKLTMYSPDMGSSDEASHMSLVDLRRFLAILCIN